MIKNVVRQFILTHERQRAGSAATIYNGCDVGIAVETAALLADVICNDHVEVLFTQLFLGITLQIAGLCGKADQQFSILALAELLENIRVRLEPYIQWSRASFNLAG